MSMALDKIGELVFMIFMMHFMGNKFDRKKMLLEKMF